MYCFLSSRRRHTRWPRDWSSDVCSSDLDSGVVRQKCGELRIKGLHGIVTVRETGEKLSSNEAYSRILQQPGDYGERIIEETRQNYIQLYKEDRKSTRLNSSHVAISYAVFCLKKKIKESKIVR